MAGRQADVLVQQERTSPPERDPATSEPVDQLVVDRNGRAAGGEAEDGVRLAVEQRLDRVGDDRAQLGDRLDDHDLHWATSSEWWTSWPATTVRDDLQVGGEQDEVGVEAGGHRRPCESRPRTRAGVEVTVATASEHGAAGEGDQVAHRLVEGERAAGQGAVGQADAVLADRDLATGQTGRTARQSRARRRRRSPG